MQPKSQLALKKTDRKKKFESKLQSNTNLSGGITFGSKNTNLIALKSKQKLITDDNDDELGRVIKKKKTLNKPKKVKKSINEEVRPQQSFANLVKIISDNKNNAQFTQKLLEITKQEQKKGNLNASQIKKTVKGNKNNLKEALQKNKKKLIEKKERITLIKKNKNKDELPAFFDNQDNNNNNQMGFYEFYDQSQKIQKKISQDRTSHNSMEIKHQSLNSQSKDKLFQKKRLFKRDSAVSGQNFSNSSLLNNQQSNSVKDGTNQNRRRLIQFQKKTVEKFYEHSCSNKSALPQNKIQEIMIDFISNYGSSNFIGLTEIKLFDKDLKEIILEPQDLTLFKNNKVVQSTTLKNLINNQMDTNDLSNMFQIPYEGGYANCSVKINVDSSRQVAFIVLWNFNEKKSVGIRTCKIFYQNNKIYEGIVLKGNCQDDGNYFTVIKTENSLNQEPLEEMLTNQFKEGKKFNSISRKKTAKRRNLPFFFQDNSNQIQKGLEVGGKIQRKQLSFRSQKSLYKNNSSTEKNGGDSQTSLTLKEKPSMKFIRGKFQSKERLFQRSKDHTKKEDQSLSKKSLLLKGKALKLSQSKSKGITFSKSRLQMKSKEPSENPKKVFGINKSKQEEPADDQTNNEEKKSFKFRLKRPFIRKPTQDKEIPKEKQDKQEINIKIQTLDEILEDKLIGKLQQEPEIQTCFLNILKSWGDQRYVGLNGLEFFNTNGQQIKPIQIEIVNDNKFHQSSPQNLLKDKMNNKRKSQHWIYNLNGENSVQLKLHFKEKHKLALLRVWNYNVSRMDLMRGAKYISFVLDDGKILFVGQINQASGRLEDPVQNFDDILFTESKEILEKISKNDHIYIEFQKELEQKKKNQLGKFIEEFTEGRPMTSEARKEGRKQVFTPDSNSQVDLSTQNVSQSETQFFKKNSADVIEDQGIEERDIPQNYVVVEEMKILIKENWGCSKEYGFSGINFYNENNTFVDPDTYQYKFQNKCTLGNDQPEKLLKQNKAVSFFLSKLVQKNYFTIIFNNPTKISYIEFFNLTRHRQQIRKGIKNIQIYLNNEDQEINYCIPIKKGVPKEKKTLQKINFPIKDYLYRKLVTNKKPFFSGFQITIHLKVTFGDPYYIGLNGLEIFDHQGKNLLVKNPDNAFKLEAEPPGVYILQKMGKDKRKIENLIDGSNQSNKYRHIWLAPLVFYKIEPKKNLIKIEFEDPFILGMINIWNYTKTATRGVKEADVFLDGQLVFSGQLNNSSQNNLSTIVFDKAVMTRLPPNVQIGQVEQHEEDIVGLVNEGNVWLSCEKQQSYDSGFRPITGLDPN